MNRLRVGVIGLNFGQHHVRTLLDMPEAHLVAVADKNLPGSESLEEYAGRVGAKPYRDGIEMMENEDLDAVSLCVSPFWREPLIACAAKKKLPMFVEKPWASDPERAQALARLCRQHDAMVMVGFSFRYHPAIVKLRELLDRELGRVWMLHGQYVFDWLPPAHHWLWRPENGNGFFNENSCHLLDAICYLAGEPVSVMAEGAVFCGRPSEEAAAITLRFQNGAIATVNVGGIAANAFRSYPRIDVIAENGQASLQGREHVWEQLTWAPRTAEHASKVVWPPESLGRTRYTHALRHFLDCVRTGKKPTATVEDGCRAVALATAIYRSARTGAKVTLISPGTVGEESAHATGSGGR
jgi:myo-inositol 2-dehydrogenase/D-chiro-inositol 1-dehydrogenase